MRRLFYAIVLFSSICSACSGSPVNPHEQQPGALDGALAEIAATPAPAGVDARVFAELRAELSRVLRESSFNGKLASGPPVGDSVSSVVAIDTGNIMHWYLENPGDYNEDGLVGISDMTPLGMYFGQTGPFQVDTAQYVADGNGDGEINIGDITPIGQNYGHQILSFTIYATGATGNSDSDVLGSVEVSSVTAEPGRRKMFSYDLSGASQQHFWAMPTDGTAPGTASSVCSERWEDVDNILPPGVKGIRADIDYLASGFLGVAMLDADTNNLLFMEALDEGLTTWSTPCIVATAINADCHPCIDQGAYDINIGYIKDGQPMIAQCISTDHTDWVCVELVAPTASASGAHGTSAPHEPRVCWVVDSAGEKHGFVVRDNKLHHLGSLGEGVVYEGENMSDPDAYLDPEGRVMVAFFDGSALVYGIWSELDGWVFITALDNPSFPADVVNLIPRVTPIPYTVAHSDDSNQALFTYKTWDGFWHSMSLFPLESDEYGMAAARSRHDVSHGKLTYLKASPLFNLFDDGTFSVLAQAFNGPPSANNILLFTALVKDPAELSTSEVTANAADISTEDGDAAVLAVSMLMNDEAKVRVFRWLDRE